MALTSPPPFGYNPALIPAAGMSTGATASSRRTGMDATRPRRSRDCARQRWYAFWRSLRFARHLGFAPAAPGRTARKPTKG